MSTAFTGAVLCILLVWLLFLGALSCRCGSSGDKVRPTLLWCVCQLMSKRTVSNTDMICDFNEMYMYM